MYTSGLHGKHRGVLSNNEVVSEATPLEAFEFATDPTKLEVLATYYFLKAGVKTAYTFTMPNASEAVLVNICEDFLRGDEESCTLQTKRSHIVKLPVRVPVGFPFHNAENHETQFPTDSIKENEVIDLSDGFEEEEEPAGAPASWMWHPTVFS
jgi:hypothetical protein